MDEYDDSNQVIHPSDSQFYREMIDDISPAEALKHLNEHGEHSEMKPEQVKEINAYFWRNTEKTIYLLLGICAFGLFAILLNAMSKYTGMIWDVFAGLIGVGINFALGAIGL